VPNSAKTRNEFDYHDHGLHPWLLPDAPTALLNRLTRYIEEKIQMKILQESFAVKKILNRYGETLFPRLVPFRPKHRNKYASYATDQKHL
jgi:hypothetical protein